MINLGENILKIGLDLKLSGGSGMRVEQFLKIPDFTEVKNREESLVLPFWFENKFSGFVTDVQGGWSGPIVSYYKRVDCLRRSYW